MAGDKVCAGFPSPAEDFAVKRIDLTQELVTHPQATFLLRVSGESMREAGIFDGDMLVVNKALKPRHGQVVVAVVDGEFTVKYLYQRAGRVKLRAANATWQGRFWCLQGLHRSGMGHGTPRAWSCRWYAPVPTPLSWPTRR